jgi:hypothetical protein
VDCRLILNKNRGLLQSGMDLWISELFSNKKSGGPGSVAQVHGGSRQRGQEGTAAPCRRAVCKR